MIELWMCMRVCLRGCAIYVMCYMHGEISMVMDSLTEFIWLGISLSMT